MNFIVHADAAWGGYMCTMLDRSTKLRQDAVNSRVRGSFRRKRPSSWYVPTSQLSHYSQANLRAMAHTDSITVDPHKTGLIPYPAGGLCYRNGSMRGFVTLTAPVVFHGEADPNIGVYGLEGSKPGAAAVATLLSHRVLGLDNNGSD